VRKGTYFLEGLVWHVSQAAQTAETQSPGSAAPAMTGTTSPTDSARNVTSDACSVLVRQTETVLKACVQRLADGKRVTAAVLTVQKDVGLAKTTRTV
jgi:hypothetical protein